MTQFMLGVMEITLTMSAVVALLLLLSKLFGQRFSAKCRYFVWLIVVARLCIPFGTAFLPSLIEVELPAEVTQSVAETTPTDNPVNIDRPSTAAPMQKLPSTAIPAAPLDPPETEEAALSEASELEKAPAPTFEMPSVETILTVAGYVWLAGAAAYLSISLARYGFSIRGLRKTLTPASDETAALYEKLCEKQKLRRAPMLYVSTLVSSPILCRYFRPLIILPKIQFTPNSLVGILEHELTHFRRRDLWVKLLCILAEAVHWFNPLAHIAAKRCNNEMELSCDESVLAGLDGDARLSYGNAMLDIIKRSQSRDFIAAKPSGTLTTQFNPKKSAVRERFNNILDMTKKKRGLWVIAAVVLLCIIAGAVIGCNIGNNGNTLPEGYWYAKGRYLSCDNGQSIIIIDANGANHAYPCKMTAENDGVSFADLTDGDRIKIAVITIEESYPAQTMVYSLEKLADGERSDIDADIIARLTEMGWIAAEVTLPDGFQALYAEAERAYALFTGYAKFEYGDKTITYLDNQYRQVAEFDSIKELAAYATQYFTDVLTDSLINTRIFGNLPLYYEFDGELYRLDGYSALWSYDVAQNYGFEANGAENDIYSVKVFADTTESDEPISAESVCKYIKSEDGDIRFNEFNLMADVLLKFYMISDAAAENPTPAMPDIYYGKYAVAATDDTVSDGYQVLLNYRTDMYKDDIIQCNIHVPHINLSKPNAEAWNAQIAEMIFAAHNQCLYDLEATDTSKMFDAVDYELFSTGEIITIAVTDNGGYLGSGAVSLEYLIYHYDTQNDRFLTTDEFLALYTGGKWTEAKILEYLNDNGYNKDDYDDLQSQSFVQHEIRRNRPGFPRL